MILNRFYTDDMLTTHFYCSETRVTLIYFYNMLITNTPISSSHVKRKSMALYPYPYIPIPQIILYGNVSGNVSRVQDSSGYAICLAWHIVLSKRCQFLLLWRNKHFINCYGLYYLIILLVTVRFHVLFTSSLIEYVIWFNLNLLYFNSLIWNK